MLPQRRCLKGYDPPDSGHMRDDNGKSHVVFGAEGEYVCKDLSGKLGDAVRGVTIRDIALCVTKPLRQSLAYENGKLGLNAFRLYGRGIALLPGEMIRLTLAQTNR